MKLNPLAVPKAIALWFLGVVVLYMTTEVVPVLLDAIDDAALFDTGTEWQPTIYFVIVTANILLLLVMPIWTLMESKDMEGEGAGNDG